MRRAGGTGDRFAGQAAWQDFEEGRAEALGLLRPHALDALERIQRGGALAGDLRQRARVAVQELSEAVRPAGERHLRRLEAIVDPSASGLPREAEALRPDRRGRLAGQDREKLPPEALELHAAHAGDAGEGVEALRPARRHLDERAVGEDDVGRHPGLVGERPAAGLERGEKPLVLLGHQRHRRSAGRALGLAQAVGAEFERRLAAQERARGLGQHQRAVALGVGAEEVEAHELAEDRLPFPFRARRAHAEGRQPFVAAAADLVVRLAAQDRDQVPGAEALAGAERGGEGHARRLGRIEELRRVTAEVAVAATRLQRLSEVCEEGLAAAAVRLGEAEKRVEALVVRLLALHRRGALVDLGPAQADVVRTVERQRVGGRPVAAGAADLLVVALDRLRQVGVRDESDVGLVHAHAEGDRGADDEPVLALEAGFGQPAVVGREAGVVGERGVAGVAEGRGEAFRAGAAGAVDDAGLAAAGGDVVEDLAAGIVLGREGQRQLRPVEAAQEGLGRAVAEQPRDDLGAGLGIGGGGQRHGLHPAERRRSAPIRR